MGDHRHVEEVLLVTMRHADVPGVAEILEMEPFGAAIGPEERVEEQGTVAGFDRQRRPAEIADLGHFNRGSSFVSRAKNVATRVINASKISMVETPTVPPM